MTGNPQRAVLAPTIDLPTKWGTLKVQAGAGGIVIYCTPWEQIPFLRLHSACMFAESLGGTDCDCRIQLDFALEYIASKGGAIVYLAQEGRGIGLTGKIQAMSRQQQDGLNTADAYASLGHAKDPRTYAGVLAMLQNIGFPKIIRLATNNPAKLSAVTEMGFSVHERFMPKFDMPKQVESYLLEKQEHLGHYG